MTNVQTTEILDLLSTLPLDKVDEVKDFAMFLRDRYRPDSTVDDSDEWSDQDMLDASLASIDNGYQDEGKTE